MADGKRKSENCELCDQQDLMMLICVFTCPSKGEGCDTRSILSLNSVFFFSKTKCHTKIKVSSLPNYLLITERRTVEFICFSKVLVL